MMTVLTSHITEIKRINSEKNPSVSNDYQSQMQLITGWLLQRCDVLQFEIGAAAVRIGAKINEMSVYRCLHLEYGCIKISVYNNVGT